MIETILVPTDLSTRSSHAMRRAFQLAAQHGADVCVTHVVDDAAPADLRDEIRKSAEKTLTATVDAMKGDVACSICIAEGDPIADILTHIVENAPDLVVMGVHRPRSFFDVLHETTVQRITRLSPVTVLMVSSYPTDPYQSILAATDFSPAATAAIAAAHDIAPGATITPVHAFHVPHAGMLARDDQGGDRLRKRFRAEAGADDRAWRAETSLPDSCTKTAFVEGSPLHALSTVGTESDATLIAVGAHGRVGQHRAILGSVASDLMRNPPCDVLIARPRPAHAHSIA